MRRGQSDETLRERNRFSAASKKDVWISEGTDGDTKRLRWQQWLYRILLGIGNRFRRFEPSSRLSLQSWQGPAQCPSCTSTHRAESHREPQILRR